MGLFSSTCHAVWTSEGGSTAARPCTEPQSQDPPWGHTGRKSRPHLAHPFLIIFFYFYFFILLTLVDWHRVQGLLYNNSVSPIFNSPVQQSSDHGSRSEPSTTKLGLQSAIESVWGVATNVNVGDCRSRTWRCASGKQHHQACYLGPWDLVLRSPGKKAFKQTWTFGTAWTMTFWTIVDIF